MARSRQFSSADGRDDPASHRSLEQALSALEGRSCALCARLLCGHEHVLAVLLGARFAPRCLRCTAEEMGEPGRELVERCVQWIRRRDCYLDAWLDAGEREGFGRAERPPCVFPAREAREHARQAASSTAPRSPAPDAKFHIDAGELGCGELVLLLSRELRAHRAGTIVRVTAHDPAAPIDLPAWCGLVGHTLLYFSHPDYWIRRKPS